MTVQPDLPQQISELLTDTLRRQNPDAQVRVKRTSLGWLHLFIITSCFEGQTVVEREQQIDEILATLNLNLGGYPFADYALLTPQESASQQPFQPIQLPLWSEILMAPEPDAPRWRNTAQWERNTMVEEWILSSWTLAHFCGEEVCTLLRGAWSRQSKQACQYALRRYVRSRPRERGHRETEQRAWLKAQRPSVQQATGA